jgi:hypothetical protein
VSDLIVIADKLAIAKDARAKGRNRGKRRPSRLTFKD